ncbi:hypothetical protein MIR68_000748 [Amoeboaphelidium protococcarum]|nr:hypothetical protein MIR68_000748 [Amoeboaphelidium protococcarum]
MALRIFQQCRSTSRVVSPSMQNKPLNIHKVGIVGAGQMGTGIAYVAALHAQLPVLLHDASQAQLDRQMKFINSLLQKDLSKNKITQQDVDRTRSLIQCTQSGQSLADDPEVDFVIEAVSESIDLKVKIFQQLMNEMPKNTILASNTSSISITKIAAAQKYGGGVIKPEDDASSRVIGMHFMNPVPVMKLVEIIPGLQTSTYTLDQTLKLAQKMGKVTTISRDIPGFIANRLLMPYINEAVYAYQEGIASREDIDTTMKLGTNMPMGPLTLADFIGLDTCLAIMKVLHSQLGDTKYRPCPLLASYVDAGWFGKKSGKGFYDYTI